MSDTESSTAALGKRVREVEKKEERNGKETLQMPPADIEDSDEEIGPMPGGEESGVVMTNGRKKKRAVLPHERLYLDHLPDSDRYFKSFMHREALNFVTVTKTSFVITTSVDGHLKFWKKQDSGIEFVKHFKTSLKAIVGVSASDDGKLFATISETGEGRVFDVVNFDMINIVKFGFIPKACCWIHQNGSAQSLLAVSDTTSSTIRIYDGRGDGKPLYELEKLHRAPVHLMVYSSKYDCVVSADEDGFVEYWQPSEPWGLPSVPGLWEYKSSTDLFHFKKTKSIPTSLTFSPNSSHFVCLALPTRSVHIFNFLTGKITRTYDESLSAISEMQQAGTAALRLEDMDFGRRMALERELDQGSGPGGLLRTANAVWDESGNFILYATMLGIKVINTVTNKVARILGKEETLRFLNLALYQGAPSKKGLQTIAMAASDNPLLQDKAARDPTLFCTAYKKQRFYLFGQHAQEDPKGGDRDVFNERPTIDEQRVALNTAPEKKRASATSATIHFNMGDVHFKLYPDVAPKTVENFVGHIKSGYFNGLQVHRVIKKFMIQTGDPLGDGTGGESIWGGNFEDEISSKVNFNAPYMLAMANAGAGTNGSQFFITTVPTPWLDGKHTIFGRAIGGLDIIHEMENVSCDKNDKPWEEVIMASLECV